MFLKSANENLRCSSGGYLCMRSETEQSTDMCHPLAERMRLNGQIHAKICQNAALSDYSRKPSPVM